MPLPLEVVEFDRRLGCNPRGDARRCAFDAGMGPMVIVVDLVGIELALEVCGGPEKDVLELFSANGSDQSLNERVRHRSTGNGFDFIDF